MFVQRLKEHREYTPTGEPVLDTFAEVQQRWHLWRRRYDLFLRQVSLYLIFPDSYECLFYRDKSHRILSVASEAQPEPALEPESFRQFAKIDQGFLAWHFTLLGARGEEIASVDRTFRGIGREVRSPVLFRFSARLMTRLDIHRHWPLLHPLRSKTSGSFVRRTSRAHRHPQTDARGKISQYHKFLVYIICCLPAGY